MHRGREEGGGGSEVLSLVGEQGKRVSVIMFKCRQLIGKKRQHM